MKDYIFIGTTKTYFDISFMSIIFLLNPSINTSCAAFNIDDQIY